MKKYLLFSGVLALALLSCQQQESAPKAETKKEEKPAEVKKEEPKPQAQPQEGKQEAAQEAPKEEAQGEAQEPAQEQAAEKPKEEAPQGGGMQPVAVSAEEAQALLNQKGCLACHDINAKKVGPAFKEVAAKYAGQADAVATLVNSITKGSTGKWGSIPMPPQPLKQEEAQKVASWILTLK